MGRIFMRHIISYTTVVTGEVSETSLLLFALTAGIQYFSGTIFQGNRLVHLYCNCLCCVTDR